MLTDEIASTKFRVPRQRGTEIPRAALLPRLHNAVSTHALTVLVAPAGYGKTTTLAQLACSLDDAHVAWISLDPNDDDPGQLFATLVRALQPLGLRYAEDPAALIAAASGAGSPARAAVGMMVNALDTIPASRLAIMLDDTHHLEHSGVAPLLEALIERLPEQISVVLAGRALPRLPLARWTVRGEAACFGPDELNFDVGEAAMLAGTLAGNTASQDEITCLRERTAGWPAGLALLLRARRDRRDAAQSKADAQLFEFLAAEVLDALPADLRRFVEDVAVLAELAPATCAAVTGQTAASDQLRVLQERDLFLVVLDPVQPILRYHDLFRDFLLARLARDPARLRELHRRAAGAETVCARVVNHWLAAGEPGLALGRLLQDADGLLAEGGHHAVERWLDQFPAEHANRDARWHYLAGLCAWRRWDWPRAAGAFRRAAELLDPAAAVPLRVRVLQYLMGAESALGNPDAARAAAAGLHGLPLDATDRAGLELQLAWCRMGDGDASAVVEHLCEAARIVATDPATIAPHTADRAHSLYMGAPGALPAYRVLLASYRQASRGAAAPWHGAPELIEGWVRLWEGELAEAEAALARAREIDRRFGGIPPLQDGCLRLEIMLLATTGRGAQALEMVRQLVERFSPEGGPRIAYAGVYVHGYARLAWATADYDAFRAVAPRASRPMGDWAFFELSSRLIPAQIALLDDDWATAATAFEAALEEHGRVQFPVGHADPRLGLAYARLRQGRTAAALAALEPVLEQCAREQAIGWLLLEPDWLVAPLLKILPPERLADRELSPMLARLAVWRATAGTRAARPARKAPGPLDALSEREREVLERVTDGAGNKEIARDLDLSVNTVKRHIANILGKLDCVSRRQAAILMRRALTADATRQ
jgi:LuxR family transcriptional regulator, maltose regulon positive regulatory protein